MSGPEAAPQYGRGLCAQCIRPLSVYNPYRVCGPCRREMAKADATGVFPWEKRMRRPVRAVAAAADGE